MADPADVALLVEFLNTLDVYDGSDDLPDEAAAAAWFAARGLPTDGLRVGDVHGVREALRAAADGRVTPDDDLALARVPLRASADDGGLSLASDHPLGPLVATALRLTVEGTWDRLKLCEMHTCRYAFYDGSRNRSGKWCSMAVCGNRAKTRAFRERHRS